MALALACTAGGDASKKAAPVGTTGHAEAERVEAEVVELEAELPPAIERPWIWFHGQLAPSFAGEVGTPGTLHVPTMPEARTYEPTLEPDKLRLSATMAERERWAVELPHAGLSEPVLTVDLRFEKPTLFVVARVESKDATLVLALNETNGETYFESLVPDLPSLSSFELDAPTSLQLGFERDSLVLYLRRGSGESAEAQVHEVKSSNGEPIGAQFVPPDALRLRQDDVAEWVQPQATRGLEVKTAEGHVLGIVKTIDPDEKPIGIGNRPARPERVAFLRKVAGPDSWKARVGSTFTTDAVVMVDEHRAYVAAFCVGSSGVELSAIDLPTGEVAWRAPVYGIGSIGHSKYSNRVRAALLDEWVVVHGRESGGEYLAVVDRDSGRLISNEIWR